MKTIIEFVNSDESLRTFNVALKYSYITNFDQWVPFEIPIEWLVQGLNTFTIYVIHEDNYDRNRPWEYNNLVIGVDTDHDYERSWWFGSSEKPCCNEMSLKAMDAEKPLSRDSAIITEHRETGYKECQGELMVLLELH